MTEKLPDQLRDRLRLVFVGTAAGQRSADLGHYYAGPGNRFWRTIHEVGITPRRYEPREFTELLKLGIGLTDVCKLGVGMDHQALKFPVDIAAFREKMLIYRPSTIAFTATLHERICRRAPVEGRKLEIERTPIPILAINVRLQLRKCRRDQPFAA